MGFSSKRLLEPYSCEFSPCTKDSKDMFVSEFREKSPVDEFLIQETENGGVPSVRLTSDIYMLFNQKRLDRMSLKSLTDYFESLSIKEPEFSALRSKLGDEQLVSFVKSRYIQSPSELMSWSQYLMSSSDEAVAALAAAQVPDASVSVEPVSSPSSE